MQLPEHIKVEIWSGHWTRQDVTDNPNKLFLFGGNVIQDFLQDNPLIPKSTQAVIRGLENAIPIMTKWTSGTNEAAYFRDIDDHEFEFYLTCAEDQIRSCIVFDADPKTIVIPSKENGIGTGTAYLQQKAPKCWELLQTFLAPLYERAEKSVISED